MSWQLAEWKGWLILGVIAWLALQTSTCWAQQPASLPAGWQQMSPTDFAAATRPS